MENFIFCAVTAYSLLFKKVMHLVTYNKGKK